MNSYDILMFPLEKMVLNKLRKNLISQAKGNVLEIGMGTGANLSLYNDIEKLQGLDVYTSPDLLHKLGANTTFMEGYGESLPFDDQSFDTVVATITLCSVDDLSQSLSEIYRVLKPGGSYIFIEHIAPKNKLMHQFFHRLDHTWSKHTGGCHINRPTDQMIRNLGFKEVEMKRKASVFIYGIAKK